MTFQYLDNKVTGSGSAVGTFSQGSAPRSLHRLSYAEIAVPVGTAGTLSLRSSASVGTLTFSGGHSFEAGDEIDIFWDGGIRLAAVVGTIDENDVPITGGSNVDLPDQDTAIVASVRTIVNWPFSLVESPGVGTKVFQWRSDTTYGGDCVIVAKSLDEVAQFLLNLHNGKILDIYADNDYEDFLDLIIDFNGDAKFDIGTLEVSNGSIYSGVLTVLFSSS